MKDINREDVKITVKVFISSPDVNLLKEAVDQGMCYNLLLLKDIFNNILLFYYFFSVCNSLNINAIESLVIAYLSKENPEELLASLKHLWIGVEEYVKIGKLSSVGLSDVDTNMFIDLFQWANVKLLLFVFFFDVYFYSVQSILYYFYLNR